MPGMPGRRGDQPEGAEEDEPGNREVDVQAPAPVDVLGQEAAEDEPEGGPGDGDGGVDPEGPAPLARVGEGRGEDRQHRRGQQRAEESLQPAGADQHERCLRRPAEGGRQGEAGHADHQRALRPEHVADAPAQEQEAAEGQRVGGDHPLPVRVGEPEGVLCRGQGDDHDRGVEHDHELRARNDDEDPQVGPARRLVGRAGARRRQCRVGAPRGVAREGAVHLALGQRPVGQCGLGRRHAGNEEITVCAAVPPGSYPEIHSAYSTGQPERSVPLRPRGPTGGPRGPPWRDHD